MPVESVYLDNNATTPIDPKVMDRVVSVMRGDFGNPSSLHRWGNRAANLVREARDNVGFLLNAKPRQLYFTSGATEGSNLIIRGIFPTLDPRRRKIITTTIEHDAVAAPIRTLERAGYPVVRLKPDRSGLITVESLSDELDSDVGLVAIIGAHNEFGTIQRLPELSAIVHQAGARLFVDAAQMAGKVPIDVESLQVDFLTVSAHKFYGPKGVGAVYVKDRPRRPAEAALLQGGGQENDLRSGTLNVAGIVGLGEAAKLAIDNLDDERRRLTELRNRMWSALEERISGIYLNGSLEERLPGNLNFYIKGLEATAILNALPELGISTGSACHANSMTPSPALLALGLTEAEAFSTLRVCIGRFNSAEEVEFAKNRLIEATSIIRNICL